MGEVRVKVRLTNSFDEALARRGQLKSEQIRVYEADALIDTGAISSVIPRNVMEQLGVLIEGQRVAQHADNRTETVDLTEPIKFDIMGRKSTEGAIGFRR